MRSQPSIIALFLVTIIFASACTPQTTPGTTPGGVNVEAGYTPPQPFDPEADINVKHFNSEEEFSAFIKSHETANTYLARGSGEMAVLAMDSAAGAKVSAAAPSAAPSFSGTNNQVATVDEADILKTDGSYIYTVTGNTLFIVKAYPGTDAEIVSTITFNNTPQGLFIEGDKLVVFGNFYDNDYFRAHDLRPRYGMTFVTIYDVSDKENPLVLEEYKFEGSYFQARMTDGKVYLIVTSGPENREIPMPLIIRGEKVSYVPVSDVYYYPMPYSSMQFVTVHAFGTDGEDLESKTLTVDNLQTIYMSEKNLYLVSSEWINEWEIRQQVMMQLLDEKLEARDRTTIQKIKNTDNDVLSQQEKESKIYQVYSEFMNFLSTDEQQELNTEIDSVVKKKLDTYDALEYTVIHKIETSKGQITVGASGEVPGRVNNQFSLDEYDGVLRVATTLSARWWGPMFRGVEAQAVAVEAPVAEGSEGVSADAVDAKIRAPEPMPPIRQSQSTNRVYTLDSSMNVLDKLENIAPDETIQSARFMGERLYLVTYRQVDPFFVIDLANPRDIKILGKLKIPGFSRYLHPYDENTIIGIGRDATDLGRQQGLKISIFDVSNVEKPKEVAKWVASDEYAQSTAEWEHKAFLFDKEKNLLVIPAYSYSWDNAGGHQNYNGAIVFSVKPTEIKLRGIIDHSTGEQYYGPQVERSLYIEELLYTKSPGLLRINDLETLKGVKKIELKATGGSGPYPVY